MRDVLAVAVALERKALGCHAPHQCRRLLEARRHRLTTSEFNQILHDAYDKTMPPSRSGRSLRLYFGTQVGIEPPTFVIFVNDPELVHFSYQRYIENCIRAYYPFTGTPIRIYFRPRNNEQE